MSEIQDLYRLNLNKFAALQRSDPRVQKPTHIEPNFFSSEPMSGAERFSYVLIYSYIDRKTFRDEI